MRHFNILILGLALALALMGGACSDDTDASTRVIPMCEDSAWSAGACGAATEVFSASTGASHVPEGVPISYSANPLSSGYHRPTWAMWGEYDHLPPERWIHNLEHGGAAFLYHPCADAALVDALRAYAKARPADAGGVFRWVLTPHADLPSAFAVVTWEHVLSGECVAAIDDVGAFLDAHYRQAPEDVAADGPYVTGWLGD